MIEVLKQALNALEYYGWHTDDCGRFGCDCGYDKAITSLQQSIAELESQDPFAWAEFDGEGGYRLMLYENNETYAEDWNKTNPNHIGWVEPIYKYPPQRTKQEPVKDDHQSFIDSLPTDGDDKMFMQIDHWARKSYKRHQFSVRGQTITAADAFESHIVWAALRWAKENTHPPQRTWVGLTDEDCKGMNAGDRVVAMWANRTLKEKNA